MSGCIKLQEDGWGRRGEGASGNNTALIIFLVFWHGDHRSRGVKKCCWHVLQWCVTSVTWSASEMKDDNMTAPLSLSLSPPIPPPPPPPDFNQGFLLPHLTVSLSVCSPDLSLFNLLRPYYVPICVTHEACLRVKNKRWKGKRGVEDWWLGAGIWRVEEGGLAVEAAVCGKVRSLFINSCLFMSPVNVASQGMKAFCLALSVPDTDPNERVVSGGR